MAIAIFRKETNEFYKCIETSADVTACNLNNTDWFKNVTISDADWSAINDGTKMPVSVNSSNEITWSNGPFAWSMNEEEFKSHVKGIKKSINSFLRAKGYASYSRRSAIESYVNWLNNINYSSISFPVTTRFEDWVTSEGGTPVSIVEIP
jgi:hypothetical protein